MTDYTEVKRLAQRVIDIEALDGGEPIGEAWDEFEAVATPSAVLALIAENERLKTLRSTTERDLAQELEVWRHGPSCWSCGDTGDVHDMVGEWRGQCDCNAAKLIDVTSERDQLKAENEALREEIEHSKTNPLYSTRANSKRYIWLRDNHIGNDPESINLEPGSRHGLNSAIDAAMEKGEKP